MSPAPPLPPDEPAPPAEHLAEDVLERVGPAGGRARRGRAARSLHRSAVGARTAGEERAAVGGAAPDRAGVPVEPEPPPSMPPRPP